MDEGTIELVKELKSQGRAVSFVCDTLGINRSSFYRKKSKKMSQPKDADNNILEEIKKLLKDKPYFGYRRVWAWLRYRLNIKVNRKVIYRIMKQNNLLQQAKRFKPVRESNKKKPRPTKPNQWWGIDMTKFIVEGIGWVYLVVVLDWYTKKIAGWHVNTRSRAYEWHQALEIAVSNQCAKGSREYGINLMSDNGCQPTSKAFIKECSVLGVNQAFTAYNNPKGNADTERVIRTLKEECIWLNEWNTFEDALKGIEKGIKEYNQDHIHSALNYLSPNDFEKMLENTKLTAA